MKIKAISVIVAAALLLALCPGRSAATPVAQLYTFNYENVLGTSFELKVLASSEAQSQKAEAAALAEVDREAAILSSYDPHSEFSRWFQTRNQPVSVSPDLFEVFGLFDLWRGRTNGALDASAEVITRAWQSAAAQHRLPTPAELHTAVASAQRAHWKLDAAAHTATHTSDAPLAMNSFVKSYIIGRSATAALAVPGVRAVVLNIGGDLVVRGDWNEPVDIADPKADAENDPPIEHLLIHDRAVATSGDYRRGVDIAGRHYSHIMDPRTGIPAEEIISSTVVAPNAADAGAMATAFSVMTPAESQRLAATMPGVEYMLVKKNGEVIASDGWSALEAPAAATLVSFRNSGHAPSESAPHFQTVAAQTQPDEKDLWNPNFQLDIGVQLARIAGERVLRPYLAVWIEDVNHMPVRNISLWYAKLRYLTELHSWAADTNLLNSTAGVNRISSFSGATRPPGKYLFRWNGKDDDGKLVKAGKYVALIEVAREHGTYQLIRQEMDFNGTPKQVEFPANTEIAAAYLDYHKVAK